jgi:hypothetical protein
MSKVIELSDEQYETLAAAAEKSHQTPEVFLARWVEALSDVQGEIFYDEEELFAALDSYATAHGVEHTGDQDHEEGASPDADL